MDKYLVICLLFYATKDEESTYLPLNICLQTPANRKVA